MGVDDDGRWPRPPVGGYSVDDLMLLRDLPPHTQLIDASLVFRPWQTKLHSVTVGLLAEGLRRTVPPEFRVRHEMIVVLDHEAREYRLTGVFDDRLVLDTPFPIDIDLTAIDQL